MTMDVNTVYEMDALQLLRSLEAQSVDAVISDFPYGTTSASWDVMPDLPKLWDAIKHALKPQGVVVTTASQPFTSMLVMSNLKWFRYEWIWNKGRGFNFQKANEQPMKSHENIVVFSEYGAPYSPQIWYASPYTRISQQRRTVTRGLDPKSSAAMKRPSTNNTSGTRFPNSILEFSNAAHGEKVHPTQKPVALYEYLILTYTQPNALVVDPFAGSGTTGIAARNTGRNFILGDTSPEYVAVAKRRLALPFTQPMW